MTASAVQFTVTVLPPSGSASAQPTGTVTLYNGATSLGSMALAKSGKALFPITTTGVGIEPFTVVYSGDSTYATITSGIVSLTVLSTDAKTPLIIPALGGITLPAEFLPGDKAAVTMTLTNGGNAPANGKVAIQLYLSMSGAIDSSSIGINVPSLKSRAVHLMRGHSMTFTVHFTAGSYPAGAYSLLAQLTPVANFTADEVSSAPLVSAATYQAAGLVFGTVGAHHGLKLKVTDAAGQTATFSIAGPGMGTVTRDNGAVDLSVIGTSIGSALTLASPPAFTVGAISVTGALKGLMAHNTTLAGGLAVSGGAKTITFAGVAPAGGTIPITLGPGSPATISLGNVGLATLTSAAPIKTLNANLWQGGQILAPSISSLMVKGAFAPNVTLTAGGKIGSARLGAIIGGVWAIPGGIPVLHVAGAVSSAGIYAGANAGPDNILGTADDIFGVAPIGTLFIGGDVTSSVIASGASFPTSAGLTLGSLSVLPKGIMRVLTLRGSLSPDSRIVAAKLPLTGKVGGVSVKTGGDPRFVE